MATLMRPRRGVVVAFYVACLVGAGVSVGSTVFDHAASARARVTYAPGDKEWVDHAKVGATDLLLLPHTPRAVTPIRLFWNKSLKNVLLLPQADQPDAFRQFSAHIASDGTLRENGRTVQRPLLVEEYLGKASLQNATRVSQTLMSSLWRPSGPARFSWLERGRYFDGWLASRSSLTVWPDETGRAVGTLKLRFYLPANVKTGSVLLRGPGYQRTVTVQTGGIQTVDVPVDAGSAWTLELRATALRFLDDGRDVSVRSFPPVFERAPALKAADAAADRA